MYTSGNRCLVAENHDVIATPEGDETLWRGSLHVSGRTTPRVSAEIRGTSESYLRRHRHVREGEQAVLIESPASLYARRLNSTTSVPRVIGATISVESGEVVDLHAQEGDAQCPSDEQQSIASRRCRLVRDRPVCVSMMDARPKVKKTVSSSIVSIKTSRSLTTPARLGAPAVAAKNVPKKGGPAARRPSHRSSGTPKSRRRCFRPAGRLGRCVVEAEAGIAQSGGNGGWAHAGSAT